MLNRCPWCLQEQIYIDYHDNEWGVPVHDDRKLFEFLVLDAAQAGLSWLTVLKKRENYRKAFDNFDARKIAYYNEDKLAQLLQNPGIIRNKLKINSAVANAKACLQITEQFGSFEKYIWQFVDNRTIINKWESIRELPAFTKESDAMSKDMKKRGFSFCGTTICYAFMQAAGLVNDHLVSCHRYETVMKL